MNRRVSLVCLMLAVLVDPQFHGDARFAQVAARLAPQLLEDPSAIQYYSKAGRSSIGPPLK